MKKRRKPWGLLLLIPPAAYLVYFLEPSKPYGVIHQLLEANDRRDHDGVLGLMDGRIQDGWRSDWLETTPELVAQEFGWDRRPPEPGGKIRYDLSTFVDPLSPGRRFVSIRRLDSSLGGYYVRLRWNGVDWRIDGLWGHGCLLEDEDSAWLDRIVRIS